MDAAPSGAVVDGQCSLALVSAQSVGVTVSPLAVAFGEIDPKDIQSNFQTVSVSNHSPDVMTIDAISCAIATAGVPIDGFVIEFVPGQRVACPANGGTVAVPPFAVPGNSHRTVTALFEPKQEGAAAVAVALSAGARTLATVVLGGRGGDPFSKPHTLHPIIDCPSVVSVLDSKDGQIVRFPRALCLL